MNFKLNKIINVKNVIIIMSWVGGEKEIWCPPITSWTPRWSVLCETLGERAIFLGSYLNCILLQSAISRAKVYKLKKDSEFYEGCKSNMSFSVAHWTQYVPAWCSGSYIFKSCKGLKIFLLTDLMARKHVNVVAVSP